MSRIDAFLSQVGSSFDADLHKAIHQAQGLSPKACQLTRSASLLHPSLPILNTYFYNKQQLKTKSNREQPQSNPNTKTSMPIDSSSRDNSSYHFSKNEGEKSFASKTLTSPQPFNLLANIRLDTSIINHPKHQSSISFLPFAFAHKAIRFQTAYLQSP